MSAKELNTAFEKMHEEKKFKEMVVYMEACESGSMFESLRDDINIYAVSAANGHESSWGTYCPPDDKVDGKSLGTCLGDLFSVNWLEDSEKASMGTETIAMQFEAVQKQTAKSHVLEWGDKSFTGEDIGEFQSGSIDTKKKNGWGLFKNIAKRLVKDAVDYDQWSSKRKNKFAVDSRDIKLNYLYTKVMRDPSTENHKELAKEIEWRMNVDKTFE